TNLALGQRVELARQEIAIDRKAEWKLLGVGQRALGNAQKHDVRMLRPERLEQARHPIAGEIFRRVEHRKRALSEGDDSGEYDDERACEQRRVRAAPDRGANGQWRSPACRGGWRQP